MVFFLFNSNSVTWAYKMFNVFQKMCIKMLAQAHISYAVHSYQNNFYGPKMMRKKIKYRIKRRKHYFIIRDLYVFVHVYLNYCLNTLLANFSDWKIEEKLWSHERKKNSDFIAFWLILYLLNLFLSCDSPFFPILS